MATNGVQTTVTAGETTIANVPGIANDIMRIKAAKASGNKLAVQSAKQTYEAKLASLQAKVYEKQANQYFKAMQEANKATQEMTNKYNALLHKTDVAVQTEKNKGLVATQIAENQGKVAVTTEEGKQDRLTITHENQEILAQMKRYIDAIQEITAGLPEELRPKPETVRAMILHRLRHPKDSTPQASMFATIQQEIQAGHMTKAEGLAWYQASNKVSPKIAGATRPQTPTAGGINPGVNQRKNVENNMLNIISNNLPMKTIEIGDSRIPLRDSRNKKGSMPTEQDYEALVDEFKRYMMTLTQTGYSTPQTLRVWFDNMKQRAISRVQQTSGLLNEEELGDGRYLPAIWDVRSFAEGQELALKRAFTQAYSLVNFFKSSAGQRFDVWLSASSQAGEWVDETPELPTVPTQTTTPTPTETPPVQPTEPAATTTTPAPTTTTQPKTTKKPSRQSRDLLDPATQPKMADKKIDDMLRRRGGSVTATTTNNKAIKAQLKKTVTELGFAEGATASFTGGVKITVHPGSIEIMPGDEFTILRPVQADVDGYMTSGLLVRLHRHRRTPMDRSIGRIEVVIPRHKWDEIALTQ